MSPREGSRSPDDSLLDEGTMLAHYRVQEPLGSGAMGTVYRAWDTSLERPVAVKVLHGRVAEEPEIVRRFEREARAAARVNHPNLTHVYFVGADAERRFFVMEYVPGESLLDHVEKHGPVSFARMIDILDQCARGLEAAHEGGVIHRDIKPGNIMLLPDGSVKVADFGLAKSLQGDVDATGAGRVMGTPRYMSPEQCRGEPVTASTDTYSLGLVGYYLLAGRHAFDGDSLGKVINDQMNAPLPDLGAVRDDLPPAAGNLLARFCLKDPAKRPGTMGEVRALLAAARPRKLDLAPLATRAVAFVGDTLSLIIPLLAIATVSRSAAEWGLRGAVMELVHATVAVLGVGTLAVWSEWRFGGMLGKQAFGVRVVHESSMRPSVASLTVRLLLRAPLLLVFPLAALPDAVADVGVWALAGLQLLAFVSAAACYLVLGQRTLSDVLTHTRVVLHRAAPADPAG